MLLDRINQTGDIKKIDPSEYQTLAEELRTFILEKTSKKGGHLASNLGVVELTMALHLAFEPEKDRIIWDVGHQSYVHKILTGRKNDFDQLREFHGLSGFPKREESETDAFDTGHSSTSLSAALGYVAARDLQHQTHKVVAIIGDGALTGGMALEALNNVAECHSNLIIILNDNAMSISRNIGGISKHLNKIRSDIGYNTLKRKVKTRLDGNIFGQPIAKTLRILKRSIRKMTSPDLIFEGMGIKCWGPVDGHNVQELVNILESAKQVEKPILIHVLTKKGKGYEPAEAHPERYHGVSPFDVETGKTLSQKKSSDWTDVFSAALCEAAEKDNKVVAITAAMPDGTGLSAFAKKFPKRFFDIGIAEQHAVTFAAGLAAGGMKPVFALYSSFLQRAYDQVVHDVCIQNLPVVLAVDRAGIVGKDGTTHQGLLDISFLTSIPGMTVCAPKNAKELEEMVAWAIDFGHPIAVRYPRGAAFLGLGEYQTAIAPGKAEVIHWNQGIALLALGNMNETAEQVYQTLKGEGHEATLVNLRFAAPLDQEMLHEVARNHRIIVTLEENIYSGGVGEHISAWMETHDYQREIVSVSVPDMYLEHGKPEVLKEMLGMDAASIVARINKILENNR